MHAPGPAWATTLLPSQVAASGAVQGFGSHGLAGVVSASASVPAVSPSGAVSVPVEVSSAGGVVEDYESQPAVPTEKAAVTTVE